MMFVLAITGVITFAESGIAYAFHKGGVGYCEGCHDLHISQEGLFQGQEQSDDTGLTGHMLIGRDPSSTCLLCHAEEGAFHNVFSKDGSRYTPGGDFYWLKKTFTANVNGKLYRSEGDNHGHNVVAADYALTEDRALTSAPGGVYSAYAMGCNSCHNPHGTISGNAGNNMPISVSGSYGEIAPEGTITGNYRLLGGIGYNGGSMSNGVIFTQPAPVAVTGSGKWTETDSNHTAYGSGMSEWCGNCHDDLVDNGKKHPSGNNAKLSSAIISNYNSYVKTGDISGTQATSYTSLVPFELGADDKSLLDPSSSSGPAAGGKAGVMCLTCHRAHASAFQDIGRWDFQAAFIADSHPKSGDGGITGSDVLNSYYGRNMLAQFGRYQRQLCNKCHLQD